MRKQILLSAMLLTASAALFTSCKKEDNSNSANPSTPTIPTPPASTSRKSEVVGTWTEKAYGTDNNNNNVLDPSEYDTTFGGFITTTTFKVDGNGQEITRSGTRLVDSIDFSWSLVDTEKTLRRVYLISNTEVGSLEEVIATLKPKQFDTYKVGSAPREYTLRIR